jgi:hypothetical protein
MAGAKRVEYGIDWIHHVIKPVNLTRNGISKKSTGSVLVSDKNICLEINAHTSSVLSPCDFNYHGG